jgi:UDP-GlcNAc3NAcA epimerase
MKIITIIGARPQFIKAAMCSRVFAEHGITELIVHTGQHFDANMSEVFFDELSIPKPAYNLGIGGGSHGQNTGRMIEAIEQVLVSEKPDWVLVYGDTDSTLAGALAAVKLHISVAHVEAGLRSFNRKMPEEINRILTDHAANFLFAPTQTAVQHLASEKIIGDRVILVGDVMFDAALHFGNLAEAQSNVLAVLGLQPKSYTLATIHRAENTDNPMRLDAILRGFEEFSHNIVMPLHPRTRSRIDKFGLTLSSNIKAIDPVGYIDMVMLEKNAALIATDSGGVQKEAYFHRVPCVTLRDETEWTELVEIGWNHLASPSVCEDISETMENALGSVGDDVKLYGEGNAAYEIVQALLGKDFDD